MKQIFEVPQSDPEYDEKIEQIKSDFLDRIIRLLGKSINDIEDEHLRLTQAFGMHVGIVNINYEVLSILDYCKINMSLLKANTYPLKDYVPNEFSSAFFSSFTVYSNIQFSQKTIP